MQKDKKKKKCNISTEKSITLKIKGKRLKSSVCVYTHTYIYTCIYRYRYMNEWNGTQPTKEYNPKKRTFPQVFYSMENYNKSINSIKTRLPRWYERTENEKKNAD